ncbi:MAG: GNAT family N-acetyltransferase [Mobilitalea sp.]
MVRLRPFKFCDAKYLLEWVQEEHLFTMWCANKFEYPLTHEQILVYKDTYENDEQGWIFTALDESGLPIGHLLMRRANYTNLSIHFGFVIIDENHRGHGYGKEMVELAVKYAFDILKVKKVTLGVFANNPAAHNCYKSVGFVDKKFYEDFFPYKDEKWGLYDMQVVDARV